MAVTTSYLEVFVWQPLVGDIKQLHVGEIEVLRKRLYTMVVEHQPWNQNACVQYLLLPQLAVGSWVSYLTFLCSISYTGDSMSFLKGLWGGFSELLYVKYLDHCPVISECSVTISCLAYHRHKTGICYIKIRWCLVAYINPREGN